MTPRLVHVEWEDTVSVDDWTDVEEMDKEPCVCQTAGYLVRESERSIAISAGVSDQGDACCILIIPRGCVRKINDLTLGEEINLSAG